MSFVVRSGACLLFVASAVSCAHGNDGLGFGGSGVGGANGVTTSGKGLASSGTGKTSSTGSKPTSQTGVTVQQAATSTGVGTPGACDTGTHGSLLTGATQAQQDICIACVNCSQTDVCGNEWQTYAGDFDYQSYVDCTQACASGNTACLTQCASFYPSADAAFQAAISCSVCVECLSNCDALNSCM